MKIRTNMVLPAVMMVVAVFAIITASLRMWQLNNWNKLYRDGFSDGGADYSVSSDTGADYFEGIGAERDEPTGSSTFELAEDIEYYDAPNGSVALTVAANSYLMPGSTENTLDFYGWRSYPTSVKGWRYARPFAAEGMVGEIGYFVKESDLEDACRAALGEGADDALAITFGSGESELSREFYTYQYESLKNDFALYESGVCCSPDLEASVWNSQTTLAMIAGVLLCGWSVVLFIVKVREGRRSDEEKDGKK